MSGRGANFNGDAVDDRAEQYEFTGWVLAANLGKAPQDDPTIAAAG